MRVINSARPKKIKKIKFTTQLTKASLRFEMSINNFAHSVSVGSLVFSRTQNIAFKNLKPIVPVAFSRSQVMDGCKIFREESFGVFFVRDCQMGEFSRYERGLFFDSCLRSHVRQFRCFYVVLKIIL